MGFMQTAIGELVKSVKRKTEASIKRKAFTPSVLVQMDDLNAEQLMRGELSDGDNTFIKRRYKGQFFESEFYTDLTEEIKERKGQITNWITWRDTGKFHESITYSYKNGTLYVNANDEHEIKQRGSIDVLGLNDKSIEFIQDEIIENIQAEIFGTGR